MTQSHKHQQIGLYDALVERARKKMAGLSLGAMELMFNFESKEQVQHALDALVESGHITIDIGGRFPSMRLHKDRHKALHPRGRALFLSSGAPMGDKPAAAAAPKADPVPVKAVEPVKMPPYKFQEPAKASTAQIAPTPPVKPNETAIEAALRYEPTLPEPRTISFTLPQKDYDALHDEMEKSGLSISLACFCIQLIRTEMDRRQSEDAAKHKLTADVIRAAREEGRDLGEFVTAMIAVGMTARTMNKGGF